MVIETSVGEVVGMPVKIKVKGKVGLIERDVGGCHWDIYNEVIRKAAAYRSKEVSYLTWPSLGGKAELLGRISDG